MECPRILAYNTTPDVIASQVATIPAAPCRNKTPSDLENILSQIKMAPGCYESRMC